MNISFLLSFAFLALHAFSQELPNLKYSTKITTLAYFSKNEQKKYHVRQSQSSQRNTDPVEKSETEYDLLIRVLDSTATSYKLEMTYLNFQCPASLSDVEKAVTTCIENLKIIYTTDENGVFTEVLNKKELSGQLIDVLAKTKKTLLAKLDKPELAEQMDLVFGGMEESFRDEENVETLFLDDILSIHDMYGLELKLNETEKLDIEYYTLNDIEVEGTAEITLKEINKATREARIEVKEQAKPGQIEAYTKELAKAFFGAVSEESMPKDFLVSNPTSTLLWIRLDSGWMSKIIHTNTVLVSAEGKKMKKTSKREYTLL